MSIRSLNDRSSSPNTRLQRTPSALPPSPLSRKPLGRWRACAVVIACLSVGVLISKPSLACDCLSEPFNAKAAVGRANAVFLGEVLSIDQRRSGDAVLDVVRFRATEAWKGVATADVAVLAGGGNDCDYPFETGRRYLVFAYRVAPGAELTTYQCSGTLLAWRERELDPIRKWRSGKKIKQ